MTEKTESYIIAVIACAIIAFVDKAGLSTAATTAIYAVLAGVGVALPIKTIARNVGVTSTPPGEGK